MFVIISVNLVVQGSIMPAPYSLDLRTRIVEAYQNNQGSIRKVAKIFDVGKSTVAGYLKLTDKNGTPKAKTPSGGRPARIDHKGMTIIRSYVECKPDITLNELSSKYYKKRKIKVSTSIICRTLKKMNLLRKKKSLYAAEQERDDVKKKERI